MIDAAVLFSIFVGTFFTQAALLHAESDEGFEISAIISVVMTVFVCALTIPVIIFGVVRKAFT